LEKINWYTKVLLIGVGILVLSICSYLPYRDIQDNVSNIDTATIIQNYTRAFELDLIRRDLLEFSELSTVTSGEVLRAITSASKQYDIPPLLLHAILRTESNYRFNLTHSTVRPKALKGISTNAIGLGGIIWEFWGETLRKEGIAETKLDLYKITPNIIATCFILRHMVDIEVKNGTAENNIIASVIRRYYGEHSSSYYSRLEKYLSDLELKRIGRQLVKK